MMNQVDALLAAEWMGTAVWLWLLFAAIVVVLLVFDLGVLNRKDHEIGVAESLRLSVWYILIAVLFGAWLWRSNPSHGVLFFTGYLIEKSLSIDNVFVISLILTHCGIPRLYQHRVLFWGVLGVILLRGVLIGVGAALVSRFEWVLYLFGAFLFVTGARMAVAEEKTHDISRNSLFLWLKKHLAMVDEPCGHAFFVRAPGKNSQKPVWHATPLFIALILVECADLVFAVDSVPAIFAVTQDPYLVYTSNIFAILGLRSLYFALAAMLHRFRYLKYALSMVLIFIGGKIFYVGFIGKFSPWLSLGVTMGLLTGGVVYSIIRTRNDSSENPT